MVLGFDNRKGVMAREIMNYGTLLSLLQTFMDLHFNLLFAYS